MKVDWKYFAQTSGYKSLKKSVNEYRTRWPSDKVRSQTHFQSIINKVCHYAHHLGVEPWVVLTTMEEQRNMNWMNYYSHGAFEKVFGINLSKRRLLPTTKRGVIRRFKHGKCHYSARWYSKGAKSRELKSIDQRFKRSP